MPPFDFPGSPYPGQIVTASNGVSYQWDGSKWVAPGSSGVISFNLRQGVVALSLADIENAGGSRNDSPVLTGDPRSVTPAIGDNDTSIATTAYVVSAFQNLGALTAVVQVSPTAPPVVERGLWWSSTDGQLYIGYNDGNGPKQWVAASSLSGGPGAIFAPIISPVFSGDPRAPTPIPGDNDTSIATTEFVRTALQPYALINSPTLTGNPQVAVQPAPGDNDNSIATTGFVAASTATTYGNDGRNFVHNSMFNIYQRGRGPFNSSNIYTADRWLVKFSGGSTIVNVQPMIEAARTAIGDEAAQNQFQHVLSGSGSGTNDYYRFTQGIENVRRLSGKTVVVSFWAVAGTAGLKVGVNFYQEPGTGGGQAGGGHGTGQTVTLATSIVRYALVFTIPPATASFVVGLDGNDRTELNFWLSAGTSWGVISGGVPVQNGTFTFWGIQVEQGNFMTPLEKPDLVRQWEQCQRFYSTGQCLASVNALAGVATYGGANLPVTMHHKPSVIPTNATALNTQSLTAGAYNPTSIWFQSTIIASGAGIIGFTYTADAEF